MVEGREHASLSSGPDCRVWRAPTSSPNAVTIVKSSKPDATRAAAVRRHASRAASTADVPLTDAAHWILTQNSRDCSGNYFIDEAVLRDSGVTDFDEYANDPSSPLFLDLLVDEPGGLYFKGGAS